MNVSKPNETLALVFQILLFKFINNSYGGINEIADCGLNF